jgi:predicted aconitase with swiveling domain
VPLVDRIGEEAFEGLESGMVLRVDAGAGTVEVVKG